MNSSDIVASRCGSGKTCAPVLSARHMRRDRTCAVVSSPSAGEFGADEAANTDVKPELFDSESLTSWTVLPNDQCFFVKGVCKTTPLYTSTVFPRWPRCDQQVVFDEFPHVEVTSDDTCPGFGTHPCTSRITAKELHGPRPRDHLRRCCMQGLSSSRMLVHQSMTSEGNNINHLNNSFTRSRASPKESSSRVGLECSCGNRMGRT